MKTLTLIATFLFVMCNTLLAQNEVLRELSSLSGINEFGIVVNIEHPKGLEVESLHTKKIRLNIEENFSTLPVSIIKESALKESDEFPIFYVHVNIMEAANFTYPFSIEMSFYQPVKLVLNRDLQTMASTWNSGHVGIVSQDMLHKIAEETIYATNQFKHAFLRIN